MLFGASTEKTAAVLAHIEAAVANSDSQKPGETENQESDPSKPQKPARKKGHGRNGAEDYPGAKRVRIPHEFLKAGDNCPDCSRGSVYKVSLPGILLRFVGQPPIQATIFELEKLRCSLCGTVFTAQPPADVGQDKYDATVASMIAVLKYGKGFPFNRVEGLQEDLQIPLPTSTQWEIVSGSIAQFEPVHQELIRQAAQGEVVYNDDTKVRILELMGANAKEQALAERAERTEGENSENEVDLGRTGLFTSGVVSTGNGQRIALFFSGRKHAGENLMTVLQKRAADLPPPIQMCDALSRNLTREWRPSSPIVWHMDVENSWTCQVRFRPNVSTCWRRSVWFITTTS